MRRAVLRGQVVFTTDSYVVQPIFFPGGDIGKLAVCGTVNDLAMRGAMPLYSERRLYPGGGAGHRPTWSAWWLDGRHRA